MCGGQCKDLCVGHQQAICFETAGKLACKTCIMQMSSIS